MGHDVICLRHKEFRLDLGKVIRQAGEMHHRRYHTMPQREDRLDQPHCAGRGLSMSQITLDRSERTWFPLGAVNPCQAAEFDRVTDRGAGAVRFNHADGAGVYPSGSQRRPIHHLLRVQRRRQDVVAATVLVGGRATQYGQDPVTIGQRGQQPLEHHHGATLGTHEPVGGDVERPAASGRREHAQPGRGRGLARFQHHQAATRQGKVALAVLQTAASHVHGKQA